MAIKKAFQDVVNFLTANQNKKVSSILDEVKTMCEAQAGGGGKNATTFHKDETGNVVAIRCYYFKRWFSPQEKAFGTKKNSSSGFNSMCKEGNRLWSQQQNAYTKAKDALLDKVVSGEVTDVAAAREAIEADKNRIQETSEGFETLEELLAHLKEVGIDGNTPVLTEDPIIEAPAAEHAPLHPEAPLEEPSI